jgi:hypothetical protein
LFLDIVLQLEIVHRRDYIIALFQFFGGKIDYRVQFRAFTDDFRRIGQSADKIIIQFPHFALIIVNGIVGDEFRFQYISLETFETEMTCAIRRGIKIRHIQIHIRLNLKMQVHTFPLIGTFDVLRFKLKLYFVGGRDDEMIQCQTEQKYHRRRDKVRIQHSRKTDAARQYRDYFGVVRHFRRKEYHRNKHKQRTERVGKERHHRHIEIEDNLFQRRLFADKIVDMFAYVEYDYYHDDKRENQKKRSDELTYYIYV